MADAPKLTPHQLRRAAVIAGLDPRTIAARLDGRPMRSTTAARADEGLRAIGVVLGSDPPPPKAA